MRYQPFDDRCIVHLEPGEQVIHLTELLRAQRIPVRRVRDGASGFDLLDLPERVRR